MYNFVNGYVKILSRRFYSPILKDVGWLEYAQLIFPIFHTFLCISSPANRVLPFQIYREMYGKLEKS